MMIRIWVSECGTVIYWAAFSLLTSLLQRCRSSEGAPEQIIEMDSNFAPQLKFGTFQTTSIISVYVSLIATIIVNIKIGYRG